MAGARTHRVGTIFTRTQGMLRSGAMKSEDRPLWFNVYEKFPPQTPPMVERPKPKLNVPEILYPEDIIRAKFYERFKDPDVVDLKDFSTRTRCQRFISMYLKARKEGDDSADLFEKLVPEFAEWKLKRDFSSSEDAEKDQVFIIDSTEYKQKLHKRNITSTDIFGDVNNMLNDQQDNDEEEEDVR